jgi:hypothetical protein
MITRMAGRRSEARPPDTAVTRERRLHAEQVRGHRFVAGWGPKRSAAVTPAPLRYWQYRSPTPVAFAFTVLVVALWVAGFGWADGWAGVRGELPLALVLGLGVLLVHIVRITVSDHALSLDVAGTRAAPVDVVPLVLVREVRLGRTPEDWPEPKRWGGWWPGRSRVVVRHLAGEGDGERSLELWVRDPEAFAAALGTTLQR